MEPTKGLLQATVVVIWAVYAAVRVLAAAGSAGSGVPDPAGGTGLLVGFLGTLPVDALVLSTAAMVVALVGLEATFALIRRYGAP